MHFTRCRSLLLIKKYKTQPPAKAGGSNCQSPLCFRLLKSGGAGNCVSNGFSFMTCFPQFVVFVSSYMIELQSASAVIIFAGKPDLLQSHHRPARWSDRSSGKTVSS